MRDIPIEERMQTEVLDVQGLVEGRVCRVRIAPQGTPAANPGFDVTPARLITGYITPRGVFPGTPEGVAALFDGV